MSALVLCALSREARALTGQQLAPGAIARVDPSLAVGVTGPGAASVLARLDTLIAEASSSSAEPASVLVSCGVAGALDPSLRSGAVMVTSALTNTRPVASAGAGAAAAPFSFEPSALATLLRGAGLATIEGGVLHSSDEVIATPGDKAALAATTGAAAVDMESGSIAEVASRHGLGFVAVRVIADESSHTIPQAVLQAMTSSGNPILHRLLLGLARRPGQLGDLLRLAQTWGRARRALTHTLPAMRTWVGANSPDAVAA